jgi:hypothetical protein
MVFCAVVAIVAAVAGVVAGPPSARSQTPVVTADDAPDLPADAVNLHPAFRLSAKRIEEVLAEGKKLARKHKSLDDLMKPYGGYTRVVRGAKDTARGRVWCYGIDGNNFLVDSYNAAILYEEPKIPERVRRTGMTQTALTFSFWLASYPNAEYGTITPADPADVKLIKVVLSDDKGHDYVAQINNSVSQSGSTVVQGQTTKSTVVNAAEQSTTSTSAYGSIGGYTSGTTNGYTSSTVRIEEAIPYSAQHPYHKAICSASFSLFDENGKARVRPDVKKLTLRIITEAGQQEVEIKLPSRR